LAGPQPVVLDDRLLIEELLVGLPTGRRRVALHTTAYWYYRACRAAVAGASGHLSGPLEGLQPGQQQAALLSLLELREDIALPDPRATVPAMARIAGRHPRLNLLNLEATAAAQLISATVWLSEQSAAGILPAVLDAERITWATIALEP
jgi:hypothetical protein